jgi:glycosyltransferase involved in cell wall biosynthesis
MTLLKVVHLTYDMRIGGTEQVIKNIIEDADTQLFDMSILCIESPIGPFGDALVAKGFDVSAFSRQPGFDWRLILKIRQYLKLRQIDILHCHQYTPWVYGVLAAFGLKTKVIFTEHGRFYPDSSTWKRRRVNPVLHLLTNATTAISKATQGALAKFENIPLKDIEVLYNGIRPLVVSELAVAETRKKLQLDADAIVLGTIARFDPIKNHQMMLEAFSLVVQQVPNAKLIIVGDGEERQNIEGKIKALSLSDRVILTGYHAQPAPYLANMDIFLLSSLSEGTSMTLLEAMSLSKPCVVTDAGGNPEIIEDKFNGYVTPNNNATAFAAAIIELCQSPEKNQRMGDNAQIRFQQRFSVKTMSDRFKSIYQSLTVS